MATHYEYDKKLLNCKCSMEDTLDIFKDTIRTEKEGSDE